MREELIINGQYCDLDEGTGITLEYVSNLLNEPGKISLSHSYTIKLPRTANNARILDLPERPAHESSMVRRYLPVHYYRNGINLIGDNAQAYITGASSEHYELVLVWDDIPELRALSESDATLNDLPDLPALSWVGNSYGVEDNGALFAKYVSSNVPKDTSGVNELIHPCMEMPNLVQRIFNQARVPFSYALGGRPGHPGRLPLANAVVLAAPSHKPDKDINIITGAHLSVDPNEDSLYFTYAGGEWAWLLPRNGLSVQPGADVTFSRYTGFFEFTNDVRSAHVLLRLKLDDATYDYDWSKCKVCIVPVGHGEPGGYGVFETSIVLAEAPIRKELLNYACTADLTITLPEGFSLFTVALKFPNSTDVAGGAQILAYGTGNQEAITVYTEREHIDTSLFNEFPLQGNLPELTQWEFFRNYIALSGLIPQPHRGILNLVKVSYMLDISRAVDWTDKLNEAEDLTVRPRGNDWAQRNLLKFADNPDNNRDPGFSFDIQDTTLKSERDWAALDFAASLNNTAIHYKSNDNGETYEDVDIKPRFFMYNGATHTLSFTSDLYGEGLKAKYATLQAALEKPVYLETTMRLTEIDLATLDLTRPVYLAQYGQYYHILKVQTSENDMCKVELLQLKSR